WYRDHRPSGCMRREIFTISRAEVVAMSRVMARRTGRFPQLADSRSGVDRERFATISPTVACCRLSYTGCQTRRACSGVLPAHLVESAEEQFGSSNPKQKADPCAAHASVL